MLSLPRFAVHSVHTEVCCAFCAFTLPPVYRASSLTRCGTKMEKSSLIGMARCVWADCCCCCLYLLHVRCSFAGRELAQFLGVL